MSDAKRTPSASAAFGTGSPLGWVLAVVALTALGLALRVAGFHESLFADEIYSYRIVANYGLLDVIGEVHDTAITPPLHYLLARVAVEFGDPTTWIRLPSVVLGAATVPLTFVLGMRTVGCRAALFAAAVAAISPFTVFYGTEARAYATMMFLVVLSTLALLIALDSGRRRWLVLYAIASALVLYAHYSGVFCIAAQAVWGLVAHRERTRELLIANAAIALAYAPWLPSFLFQGDEHPPEQISLVSRVTLDSFIDAMLGTFPGRPFVVLEVVPGRAALFAMAAAVALAVGAALWSLRGRGLPRPSRQTTLLVGLAVATPIGITTYSLAETSLFGPRNLAASLPAAWLLLGRLLTAPRWPLGLVAPAVVLGALAVGTARSLEDGHRRPPYREAAAFVDDRARGCDPVVEVLWLSPKNALSKALPPQLRRDHPVHRIPVDAETGWGPVAQSQRVTLVVQPVEALSGISWNRRLGGDYELRERRTFPGAIPVVVYEYRRTRGRVTPTQLLGGSGDERIRLPGGDVLPVDGPGSTGFVEVVFSRDEVLNVHGWAIDSRGERPARRVVVFDEGGCLVASGRPRLLRDDVAAAEGAPFRRSGFRLEALPGDAETLAQPGRLRVFGVSGSRAWELSREVVKYPNAR